MYTNIFAIVVIAIFIILPIIVIWGIQQPKQPKVISIYAGGTTRYYHTDSTKHYHVSEQHALDHSHNENE